jgi:hypothetical protein
LIHHAIQRSAQHLESETLEVSDSADTILG